MIKRRRNPAVNTVMMAGWILADLMLGLAMLFFVLNTGGDIDFISTATFTLGLPYTPSPSHFPTSTHVPTSTPSPTPTLTVEEVGPVGLSPAQCYNIVLNSPNVDRVFVVQQLQTQIPNSKSIRAGLVLIWTHGSTVEEGVSMSRQVGDIIRNNFKYSFSDAKMKSLRFVIGPLHLVQLEVYFYTDAPWTSGFEVPCSYNY